DRYALRARSRAGPAGSTATASSALRGSNDTSRCGPDSDPPDWGRPPTRNALPQGRAFAWARVAARPTPAPQEKRPPAKGGRSAFGFGLAAGGWPSGSGQVLVVAEVGLLVDLPISVTRVVGHLVGRADTGLLSLLVSGLGGALALPEGGGEESGGLG